MKNLICYKLDAGTGKGAQITCPDTLEAFYEHIGTTVIDIVHKWINGIQYAIVCDDNGLLRDDPIVTAAEWFGEAQLVGTLLFCRDGNDGELASLKPKDVKNIESHMIEIDSHSIVVLD